MLCFLSVKDFHCVIITSLLCTGIEGIFFTLNTKAWEFNDVNGLKKDDL